MGGHHLLQNSLECDGSRDVLRSERGATIASAGIRASVDKIYMQGRDVSLPRALTT